MSGSDKILRAGVVGAGVFGGYHASKYAGHARTELVGIYDPDLARAQAHADKHGGRAYDDLGALIADVDVLTVASPALYHHAAAKPALEAGVHVLAEKPLAATVDQARELVELAKANELVLQVGHQERFVFRAMGLFDVAETPKTIMSRRMGPPSDRNLDVSVTLDLMVHDLDLAIALAGEAPIKVEGRPEHGRRGAIDQVEARLTFANGCVAEFVSSRVHHGRDRRMSVEYASGRLDIDFIEKSFENSTPFALNADFAEDPTAKDSLGANVNAFIASVLDGAPVAVPGEAGLLALDAARAIDGARDFGG